MIRGLVLAAAAVVAGLPGPTIDPARFRPPQQGLVVRAKGGVVLVNLRGRVLGHLSGFRIDDVPDLPRRPREVLLRKGRAEFALGRRGVRPAPRYGGGWPSTARGCHPGPSPFVICGYPHSKRELGSTVYLRGRKLLGPSPSRVGISGGYWLSVQLSPDRRTLLLQWLGLCETQTAYFARADGSRLRPAVGDRSAESGALGWARDGRAVLDLPRGVCGTGFRRPGIYLVDPDSGRHAFLHRGSGRLWGSAFSATP